MTTNEPQRGGYRGTLPAMEDRLARPWLLIIIGFFVLIFVLSFLGVPSRLIPEPTPVPPPTSPPATETSDPSPTLSPSPSPTGE